MIRGACPIKAQNSSRVSIRVTLGAIMRSLIFIARENVDNDERPCERIHEQESEQGRKKEREETWINSFRKVIRIMRLGIIKHFVIRDEFSRLIVVVEN